METHDFSNAKVGDIVTDVSFGCGEVARIEPTEWPIVVKFETGALISFTQDGRVSVNRRKTLYHGHTDFKIELINQSPYKIGEWIAVKNIEDETWLIAKFENIEDVYVVANKIYWQQHRPLSSFNQSK